MTPRAIVHTVLGSIVALFASSVFFFATTQSYIVTIVRDLFGKNLPTCGCETLFQYSSHPILYSLLLAAGIVVALFWASVIIRSIAQIIQTHRFITSLKENRITTQRIELRHALFIRVHTIESNDFFAFCSGIVKPTIWVSRAVMETLSSEEVHAVLHHEASHIHAFHIVQKIIIENTIRSLPLSEVMQNNLLAGIEHAFEAQADEAALEYTNQQSLLSACVTFADGTNQWKKQTALNAAHAFSTSEQRIHTLMGRSQTIRIQRFPTFITAVAIGASLIIGATTIPAHAATIDHNNPEHAAFCIQEQQRIRSEATIADTQSASEILDQDTQCIIPTMSVDPKIEINYSK